MKPIPEPHFKSTERPVVVIGATGMLGTDIVAHFKARGAFLCPLSSRELDITDERAVAEQIGKLRPALVINAAAYTNVDLAETERAEAQHLNAEAPGYLAEACSALPCPLVHFSTDQVFDGSSETPHVETDRANPLNHYAHTKWLGEKRALQYDKSLVLRVQWLYGAKRDRFSPLKQKEIFSPFADQIGCPTWTKHIAEAVYQLVSQNVTGLFHFAYDDHASWADVFQFVKEFWHLPVTLQSKLTSELSLPAKRPLFSVLSNEKIKTALGRTTLGSWREALGEFLKEVD